KPKPKTVAEAKARLGQQRLATAGERSKQDGGVRERNLVSSLDAIGSPFGAYDAVIVAAIQDRWYALLEQRNYASDKTGKVGMEFLVYILLFATSITGLCFIIERAWMLRWHKVIPPEVEPAVESCKSRAEVPMLRQICEQHSSPLSRLVLVAADHLDQPKADNA